MPAAIYLQRPRLRRWAGKILPLTGAQKYKLPPSNRRRSITQYLFGRQSVNPFLTFSLPSSLLPSWVFPFAVTSLVGAS